MIDYAVEVAQTQGSGFSSTISSYKMGERTIAFRENSPIKEEVLETIRFYQPVYS
jgi:hypothetical protein